MTSPQTSVWILCLGMWEGISFLVEGSLKILSSLKILTAFYMSDLMTSMTNPDSVLKSRNITLPTKVCIVKAMVFPVVMYKCESWTIKKAEH